MSDQDWLCSDPKARARQALRTTEVLRRLEGKWKIVILSELFGRDALRFSELERAIPGVTQKVLIRQLKELKRDGLVLRRAYPVVPPKVEYALTPSARALAPAIGALIEWAAAHAGAAPPAESSEESGPRADEDVR